MTNVIDEAMNEVLRDLGVNYTDKGFLETILAMRLVWESEDNLFPVNRKIYDVIGPKRGRTHSAVSSAIRRTALKAWEHDKEFFLEYDDSLLTAPSNVKFFEILLRYLNNKILQQEKPNRAQ